MNPSMMLMDNGPFERSDGCEHGLHNDGPLCCPDCGATGDGIMTMEVEAHVETRGALSTTSYTEAAERKAMLRKQARLKDASSKPANLDPNNQPPDGWLEP